MVKQVDIVAPQLKLTLEGSQKRYTDTIGEYTLKIENGGTAPALDVRLAATLIGDGRPYVSKGASWDAANRRYIWSIPALDPGKAQAYTFRVRYGGLGVFQVNGEAVAKGGLKELKSCSTSVEGNALVDLSVAEELRVLDINQATVFNITLQNLGTKEAHQIRVHAELSPNMEATLTAGTEEGANATDATRTKFDFPVIDRLAPGGKLVLGIKARAKASGLASCRVFMSHEDLKEGRVEGVTTVTVTDTGILTK